MSCGLQAVLNRHFRWLNDIRIMAERIVDIFLAAVFR